MSLRSCSFSSFESSETPPQESEVRSKSQIYQDSLSLLETLEEMNHFFMKINVFVIFFFSSSSRTFDDDDDEVVLTYLQYATEHDFPLVVPVGIR